MSTTTVSKLATALKLSSEKLILQLNDAGIAVTDKNDVVSNDQKLLLLNHLRGSHGTKSTASSAPKKLTINRRSQSELKLSGSFGRSRTVNVEVRKKRTYLKKETLIDQAKKELEEQKKLEQEKQKQIEEEIFNNKTEITRKKILEKLIPYIESEIKTNQTSIQSITRHTFGLFTGMKGSKYWKKYLNRIKLMNGNIKDIILNGVVNINE